MRDELSQYELSKWCEFEYTEYKRQYAERSGMLTPAKYYASLLALFSRKILPLEKVAEWAGCTYGSLRVWRAEENFKKQVKDNIARFSKYYISRANQFIKYGKYIEPIPGMGFKTPSKKRIALAGELAYYSRDLQKAIILTLSDESMRSLIITTTERILRKTGDLKTVHIMNLIRISGLHSAQELFLKSIEDLLRAGTPVDSYMKTALNTSKGISERLKLALEEAENL